MGSDESRFNVLLIVTDRVTRQCPQTTTFEEKGEPPKGYRTEVLLLHQPNALPLGQTGMLPASAEAGSTVSQRPLVIRAHELCESRGGRSGLPSLINLWFLWT